MPEYYYTNAPTSEHEDRHFTTVFMGKTLAFDTDAGVFSKQHVDPGSELLCKSLPELHGRVLDMGCGWGAMTVMTLSRFPSLEMTMADVNERALALAAQNVAKNHMQAKAVLSDGFAAVEGEFDAATTDPPIRAGKAVIYRMFEDAKAHLAPGGALYLGHHIIVSSRAHRAHSNSSKELYANAEVIARDGGLLDYRLRRFSTMRSMQKQDGRNTPAVKTLVLTLERPSTRCCFRSARRLTRQA